VRRILVLAIAACAIAPGAARAQTKPRFKPKPDLKITTFEVHLSKPAYAVVDTSGELEPIEVHFIMVNQGNKISNPSHTSIYFDDSAGHTFQKTVPVRAIKPHKHFQATVEIKGAHPHLGFGQLGGVVDVNDTNKESDEHNNLHRGPKFAIVAKEWDVSAFDRISKGFFVNETAFVKGGFKFVLHNFDHTQDRFVYLPHGQVTYQITETGICTASFNDTKTLNPSEDGFFTIDADLGGYDAVAQPSGGYDLQVNCVGAGTHTEHHDFPLLETFLGVNVLPAMQTDQEQISRTKTDPETMTTWTWDFSAKLGQ
jgi:hypothetical protein